MEFLNDFPAWLKWLAGIAGTIAGGALFLRLRDDHVVTATFKYSKVALKREGYDPAVVHDALYVLTPGGYVPMTDTIWQALSAGTHRFD